MYCMYGLQEEAKQNREQKLVCLEDSWEKLCQLKAQNQGCGLLCRCHKFGWATPYSTHNPCKVSQREVKELALMSWTTFLCSHHRPRSLPGCQNVFVLFFTSPFLGLARFQKGSKLERKNNMLVCIFWTKLGQTLTRWCACLIQQYRAKKF